MLLTIFYDIALCLLALIAIPKLLYQLIFHKKYRQSLAQRFGIGFPEIAKNGRKLIWIHAVSMGETKAIASLAKKIKREQGDPLLLVSTVTETGFAEAKRSIPEADYHVFFPFDFNWIIRPIIKRTSPDLVILCETDFWYNFLKSCKDRGAKIILVNGKISNRSLHWYQKLSWFTGPLFSLIDHFCLQSKHYRERFVKLGVPRDKMVITGNLKFDGNFPKISPEEILQWKKKLGIGKQDLVLVAGSTHDPEEKIILKALQKIWDRIPNLSLILVPRHPERFDEVAGLLTQQNIPFRRYSQLQSSDAKGQVLLVDTMGLLRQLYQLADLALVAGSFTPKVGGHNIIEPSWYGVPVIFGPYMHSQPELIELVKEYHAGLQVHEGDLASALEKLLENADERKSLGESGSRMVNDLAGATERTYQRLKDEI